MSKPKWTWCDDSFDTQAEVERAIASAFIEQLCQADTAVAGGAQGKRLAKWTARARSRPMTDADFERMALAREKKRRKAERYLNTPEAQARRLQMTVELEAGVPMECYPLRSPEPEQCQEVSTT